MKISIHFFFGKSNTLELIPNEGQWFSSPEEDSISITKEDEWNKEKEEEAKHIGRGRKKLCAFQMHLCFITDVMRTEGASNRMRNRSICAPGFSALLFKMVIA